MVSGNSRIGLCRIRLNARLTGKLRRLPKLAAKILKKRDFEGLCLLSHKKSKRKGF